MNCLFIKKKHKRDGNFATQCLFNKDCFDGHKFTSVSGLYKHMYKYHMVLFTSFSGLYKHLRKYHRDFFRAQYDGEIYEDMAITLIFVYVY